MGKNLIKKIVFWFEAARVYSIPMSVMSWSIPFLFGIIDGGNIFYGILALVGIIFAHAGVNLFDDYADYKIALKSAINGVLPDNILQKGKCLYLINKKISLKTLASAIILCFLIAIVIGLFLALKAGLTVIYLMIAAGIIGLAYPFLTYVALGEVAVAIMFSPLLYIGVYFVMMQSFSTELTPLAISTGFLTVSLLHAHMFLDFDYDKNNKKITLCSLAGSKKNSVITQAVIMFLAYINIVYLSVTTISRVYLISLLSVPTAIILLNLMKKNAENSCKEINTNIFFGILENLKKYDNCENRNFMITFMVARNVMVEFSLLVCIAKIITEFI